MKAGEIPGGEGWGKEPESDWGLMNALADGSFSEGTYPTQSGNYLAFYDNLYEAIRENKNLAVTPEEARDVIRIIEAAYESSKKKKVMKLSK